MLSFPNVPGLDFSIWVSQFVFVLAAFGAVLACVVLWWNTSRSPIGLLVHVAVALTVAIGATLFPFMIIFSLAHFTLDPDFHSWVTLKNEIIDGSVALKLSSIIVAYHGLYSLFQMIPDAKNLRNDDLWQNKDALQTFYTLNFLQAGAYTSAVLLLILCEILGLKDVSVTILSWVVFFIVDDWAIIKYYSERMQGYISNYHVIVLKGANFVIAVLMIYITILRPHLLFASFVLFLLVIFVWNYFLIKELHHDLQQTEPRAAG